MEQEYLKTANDWVVWYNWNRSQMANAPIEKQLEFLQKANYGQMKLIAGLIDQILLKEGGGSPLILPVAVKW